MSLSGVNLYALAFLCGRIWPRDMIRHVLASGTAALSIAGYEMSETAKHTAKQMELFVAAMEHLEADFDAEFDRIVSDPPA